MIEKLTKIVPPPATPVEGGSTREKAEVEAIIGLALPDELYELASAYGTGEFANSLTVLNPFSNGYRRQVLSNTKLYRQINEDEGGDYIPYAIYPDSPGLYPIANDNQGSTIWWLTEGLPNEWPILLMDPECNFEKIDASLQELLIKLFTADINCIIWSNKWLRKNFVNKRFEPSQV